MPLLAVIIQAPIERYALPGQASTFQTSNQQAQINLTGEHTFRSCRSNARSENLVEECSHRSKLVLRGR